MPAAARPPAIQGALEQTMGRHIALLVVHTAAPGQQRRGARSRAADPRRRPRPRDRASWSPATRPSTSISSAWCASARRGRWRFIVVATYVVLFVLLGSILLPAQGRGHEFPVDQRLVRRAGVDLPGRTPGRVAPLHARPHRDGHAADHVLRDLRPVDGLRRPAALPHPRGVSAHRRQHARRRRGARAHRPI